MRVAGAQRLGADELQAQAAAMLGQDLGDGAQTLDVALHVGIEIELVGVRQDPRLTPRAAEALRQRGVARQVAQSGAIRLLAFAEIDRQTPAAGAHTGCSEAGLDLVEGCAAGQVGQLVQR